MRDYIAQQQETRKSKKYHVFHLLSPSVT